MKKEKQKNLLLVEDEVIIGMTESMELKKYGYCVKHVSNGEDAIDAVYKNDPPIDLILMDINLGSGVFGTDVAKIILKDYNIPIIFLSSHTEREIVEKTEEITSFGYVVKNTGITVLDASIKMAFRLHVSYLKIENQKNELEINKNNLQFSEKRYRRLFETAKDGILILNFKDGMIVDANPFLMKLIGYTKDDILEKKLWEIGAFSNIDYSKHLFKELQNKDYVRYIDLPLETIDGKLIHVEFISNVYIVDNEKVIQCNIRDIADRLQKEKILTNQIDINEALIKEIQHRTKNSFNMITSLIHLKGDVTQSEETNIVLNDLTMRVKSISDLYSLLYETNSYYNVQLETYCEKIINSMFSYTKNISINKTIDEITVSAKDAATIGMIIVELFSNSIKYAFPGNQKGVINIELKKVNSEMKLIFEDNGIGLPNNFNIKNLKTLGFKLVNLMAKQLNCEMKIFTESGTKIIIGCKL